MDLRCKMNQMRLLPKKVIFLDIPGSQAHNLFSIKILY